VQDGVSASQRTVTSWVCRILGGQRMRIRHGVTKFVIGGPGTSNCDLV
jgi:hypothetical protein